MRKSRWWVRLFVGLTLLGLVAAACGDVDDGGGGETGSGETGSTEVPDNSDTTVTIAVNAWVGAAANAHVAKVLLEDKLGYTVELVDIDEFEQFPAIAAGDIDATLEIWPSGHAKDYKQYIENEAGVVDGGEIGVIGQIGWWVPTYLVEENPDLATFEGLKGNESMFATSETGDSGQLLDGDPSFVDVRPGDRRQPRLGPPGRLRGLRGGAADGARQRVPEPGPVPVLLLDAALGTVEVRAHDDRAARGQRSV